MSLCVCFSVSVYLSPFSNSIDDFITHPGVQTKDLLLLFCSVCNLLLQQSTAIFTAQIHPKLVLLFVSTATTQIQLISCLDPCNNLFLASFFHFCLPVVYSTYSRQHGHSRHSLAEAVASPHTLHHGLRSPLAPDSRLPVHLIFAHSAPCISTILATFLFSKHVTLILLPVLPHTQVSFSDRLSLNIWLNSSHCHSILFYILHAPQPSPT